MATLAFAGTGRRARTVRRKIVVGHYVYVVELTTSGLKFRQYRHRTTITLPWSRALASAERLAGDEIWHQRELERALRRTKAGK